MINLVKAVKRPSVDAEQGRLPVGHLEAIEIDQQAHHAIAETVSDRFEAGMHDVTDVKRGSIALDLGRPDLGLSHGLLRGFRQRGRRLAPRRRGAQAFGNGEC